MIELDSIAIHKADSCMRAKSGNRKLLQEVFPDLNVYVFLILILRLVRMRQRGRIALPASGTSPSTGACTAWSRLVVSFLCLAIGIERLIRRSLSRWGELV